ncbi:hypothetical protein GCM10010452_29970 [Crossiella cryophila]
MGGLVHERRSRSRASSPDGQKSKDGGKVKDKSKDEEQEQCSYGSPIPVSLPIPNHIPGTQTVAVGKLGRRQVAVCAPGMWCVLSRLTGMGEPLRWGLKSHPVCLCAGSARTRRV